MTPIAYAFVFVRKQLKWKRNMKRKQHFSMFQWLESLLKKNGCKVFLFWWNLYCHMFQDCCYHKFTGWLSLTLINRHTVWSVWLLKSVSLLIPTFLTLFFSQTAYVFAKLLLLRGKTGQNPISFMWVTIS